jgi:hypothetical protein
MRGMSAAMALLALGLAAAAPAVEDPAIASERPGGDRPGIVLVAAWDSPAAAILDAAQQRAIERELQRIWAPHLRVSMAWPGALVAPAFDERLELVVTNRLPPSGSPDALGWVDFLAPERPARTITISLAAARRLAAQARWPVNSWPAPRALHDRFIARTLARSIAHELGHFLLRSSAHGPRGLMRARFTASDMFESEESFGLEPPERAALDVRLRSLGVAQTN